MLVPTPWLHVTERPAESCLFSCETKITLPFEEKKHRMHIVAIIYHFDWLGFFLCMHVFHRFDLTMRMFAHMLGVHMIDLMLAPISIMNSSPTVSETSQRRLTPTPLRESVRLIREHFYKIYWHSDWNMFGRRHTHCSTTDKDYLSVCFCMCVCLRPPSNCTKAMVGGFSVDYLFRSKCGLLFAMRVRLWDGLVEWKICRFGCLFL